MNRYLGITLGTVLAGLTTLTGAFGQSATLLPNAVQTFVDNNGKPLANGNVFFYVPSTTTPKTTWVGSNESGTAQPNPVPLGISGRPASPIYGDGIYRQIVQDQFNNVIWDALTASTGNGSGPTPPSPTIGDGNIVGTILPWAGLVAPPNYVFAYGQAISRATYTLYTSTVTIITNLICTSGLNVLSGIADTSQIRIGAPVEATCIPPGTTVTAVASNSVTVSANASISTATSAQFFPYGNGDGSTTLNVPDFRGRTLAGRDNMGGTSAGTLTQTYYGANTSPDALGSAGGAQSSNFALMLANLPPYTPAGTITNGAITISSVNGLVTGSAISTGGGSLTPGGIIPTATQAASTFLGTAQGGTSTPIVTPLVQPTVTMNYVIKVLPDTSTTVATGVAALGGMTGIIACGANVTCGSQTISFVAPSTAANITVGTTTISGGTPNGLLYDNAGALGNLATANNGVLVTNGSGVPSIQPGPFILVTAYGAVCDNTTDDTSAIQAAITAAQAIHAELDLPAATCKVTSPLVITGSLRVKGQGVEPYSSSGSPVLGRGPGSWLHFAHLGKGFFINGVASSGSVTSGVEFVGFGTYRDQTTPGSGWAPIAADYDISINQSDVLINDVMLLNPTKGVYLTNGGFGRLTIDNLRGQPLSVGINIEESFDIVRVSNVHFWPFWSQNVNVTGYTENNLDALWLQRVDGPQIHNFFVYNPFHGIRISQTVNGTTNLLNATNISLDGVGGATGTAAAGIYVDSSVVSGTSGRFSNVYVTSLVAAYGLNVLGTNANYHFANVSLSGITTAGINIASGSNHSSFTGLDITTTGNGVVVGSGSTVDIAGNPLLTVSGTNYSGSGVVNLTNSQNAAQMGLGNYYLGGGNITGTGNNNTAFGFQSLNSLTTGSQNIAAGVNSCFDVTTGSDNTCDGFNTGRGVSTGSNNTIIGSNVGGLSAGLSGAIILSDGAGNIRGDYGKTTPSVWTFGNINAGTITASLTGHASLDIATNSGFTGVLLGNGASPVTAETGTANYLLKWTNTSGGLSGTSLFYDNGTVTGVGLTPTACSAAAFNICNTGSSNVGFSIGNSSTTNGFNFAYAGIDAYAYNIQNGNFLLGVNNATVLQLATGVATVTGKISASAIVSGTAHISTGSVPVGTTGSCIASSFAGGATAGTFSAAVCVAGTIILSSLPAAPAGYSCWAQDRTTTSNTLLQTASSTTSATFKATTTALDAIQYSCIGY